MNLTTKEIEDSIFFDIGRAMLYTYNSTTQLVDVMGSKIIVASPIEMRILLLNENLKIEKEYKFENETNCSTPDSLKEYFDNSFLVETRNHPKNRIKRLKDSNAYYWERIEKIFFVDNEVIGFTKRLPGLPNDHIKLIHYSLNNQSVLFDKVIDVVSDSLTEFAPNSLIYSTKYNVINGQSLSIFYNLKGEEDMFHSIGVYNHPSTEQKLIKFNLNQIIDKNTKLQITDYKFNNIKLSDIENKYIMFTNLYTCFSCFEKNADIAIIITQPIESKLSRLAMKKDIIRNFSNSSVFFLSDSKSVIQINVNTPYVLN